MHSSEQVIRCLILSFLFDSFFVALRPLKFHPQMLSPQRQNSRVVALIGVLPSLAGGERWGRGMICTMMETAANYCHPQLLVYSNYTQTLKPRTACRVSTLVYPCLLDVTALAADGGLSRKFSSKTTVETVGSSWHTI